MPLIVGVLNYLLSILGIDCIQDIEEVLPARSFIVRVFILEVDVELLVLLQVWPKSFSADLFITRNVNIVDLILLHKLLFANQNLPHKVLVDLLLWWHIHLDYKEIRY